MSKLSFSNYGCTKSFVIVYYKAFTHRRKVNLMYAIEQDSQVSWLAQTGFAAFGEVVQLISGSPYAETEQLSR